MTAVPAGPAVSRAGVTPAVTRSRRGSIRSWLASRGLIAGAAVLRLLPIGVVQRGGHLAGRVLYRVQPARVRLVRDNLRRICRYLAERDLGGERVAAAARDERALEALVREAFGHYVRGYLESATLARYATAERVARITADDPDLAEAAFGVDGGRHGGGALILIALHFGSIEIPALWTTHRGVPMTAPMETIDDPHLQRYFERTRARTGLNVIPLSGAARTLRNELAEGRAVALVADRPVGGSGIAVELFGAPARLPAGPAVLAMETGAQAWVVATRRVGHGDYRARLERIEMPADGSRRERVSAFVEAQARAFERAVADAPEQWWTVFFPIWKDRGGEQ